MPKNTQRLSLPLALSALLLSCFAVAGNAADWPRWGRDNSCNMVSEEKGLPDSFSPGVKSAPPPSAPGTATTTDTPAKAPKPDDNKFGSGIKNPDANLAGPQWGVSPKVPHVDPATTKNVRWIARMATHCYGSPVVAGGKVFVGVNSDTHYDEHHSTRGGGAELCFDAATGKVLWQLLIPTAGVVKKDPLFNYDCLNLGVCSTAVVEGNRLYFCSNRDEVLCMDIRGETNGNDGPFRKEAEFMASEGEKPATPLCPTDGDIIWRVNMLTHPDVECWPQDANDCSILVVGDYLYVCPSNGVNRTHKVIPRPNCPSLIVIEKKTGKIIARDDAKVGPKILHGEWCSPSSGVVNGRQLVFFGAGDGCCYAFDAKPAPPERGERLGRLKTVWKFDLNAAAHREGKYRSKSGPSECIATPVFYNNRVYASVGQDPKHGRGRGELVCIDATKTGDITESGKVWLSDEIDRSLSTVAIADGLLFTADNSGRIFCLDADTGKKHWMHDMQTPICCSPVVADGKMYIGTDDGDFLIFAASKEKKLINNVSLGSGIVSTPAIADGTIFIATQSHLYAVAAEKK